MVSSRIVEPLTIVKGEFPAMTEQEAEPFKPELQPLLKTHKYHFEYVYLFRRTLPPAPRSLS